jgi:Cu+-exporting ATPase
MKNADITGATMTTKNDVPASIELKDPVCGMQVAPGKEAGRYAYGGKTYLFCSKCCLHAFSADPERYVGSTAPAGGSHAAHAQHVHAAAKPATTTLAKPGAQYTCPMHPEILRDAPGACPKCGMALVPVGAAAAE